MVLLQTFPGWRARAAARRLASPLWRDDTYTTDGRWLILREKEPAWLQQQESLPSDPDLAEDLRDVVEKALTDAGTSRTLVFDPILGRQHYRVLRHEDDVALRVDIRDLRVFGRTAGLRFVYRGAPAPVIVYRRDRWIGLLGVERGV